MWTRSLLSLFAVAALHSASAESLPIIKAKSVEPVIEELMGGCSLLCAFAWSVEEIAVNSTKRRPEPLLNDENPHTAWVAAEPTTGVGVKLRFVFPAKLTPEQEKTPLFGMDVINGYWETEELWDQHARVKKARLYYNDKPFRDILFNDSQRWQRVTFTDIFVQSGDSMVLEILEVYPGKGSGAAITEFVLQGAH